MAADNGAAVTQERFLNVAPSGAPDTQGLHVPDRTLQLLRDLVNVATGIYFADDRLAYLRERLGPLAVDRGFESLLDYYYLLKYDTNAEQEWARVVDTLSVQETYFWRESDQLLALVDQILPRLAKAGRLHVCIWSLPCASGEEPLSVAMALEERGWFDRMRIELHAGDASEAALRKAAAGRYGARAFRQLSPALREKYFTAEPNGREWAVNPSLKARVATWSRLNVVRPGESARLCGADVIFCRNLFIYFTEATVRSVVERFADSMRSPAFLCVGAAESLLRLTTRFELQDVGGAYVYAKT